MAQFYGHYTVSSSRMLRWVGWYTRASDVHVTLIFVVGIDGGTATDNINMRPMSKVVSSMPALQGELSLCLYDAAIDG
jgi:hypothetical protein